MANLSPVLVAWYVPPVVMAARVNMPGTITYPVQDITFDTVTTGAFSDCSADMFFTLGSAAGLDDYGRGRLRAVPTSTVLKVGRASQGTEDGQLNIVDNAFITVWLDYRVHAKISTIIDYVEYKDSDLAVSDNTSEPPPICNMGSDCARRIDDTAGTLRLFFAGSTSIPVADAATIASYAWTIDANSAFALGTTATDDDVFIDFDPGWHWVTLTVTDSNGKTATGRRLVYAYDPDDPDTIQTIKRISITRTQQGGSCQLELVRPLLRSSYPDGGHVLIWEDRDTLPIPASRDDQVFTGWHQVDQASSRALETLPGQAHLQKETRLTLVGVLGRLDSLPGWPQRVEVPTAEDLVDPGMNWGYMPTANMDKFSHYLLHWHSTADGVADFYPSDTWETYPFVIFDSGGATLYEQLQRQANRIVPDHNFTCDRIGAMRVVVDPMLQPVADRDPDNENSVTEQGISAIEFGYQRPPRVHTLRGSALLTQDSWLLNEDDEKELLTPVFAIAPGTAPGQGGREATIGERLAQSQEALNDCVGQHYARMNARYGEIRVTPNLNSGLWSIDPASHRFAEVILAEEYLPQRGTDFFNVRALPKEVHIEYTPGEQALSRRGTVTFELETQGLPALTEPVEPPLDVGEQPAPPDEQLITIPPDNGLVGGQEVVVGVSKHHFYKTSDFQTVAGSGGPTWTRVDFATSASEEILSWVVDPFSPGYIDGAGAINGWVATKTAIVRVEDLFGTFSRTTEVTFPIALTQPDQWRTIQASFGAFFAEGVNPWLLCVSYYGDEAGHTGTWACRSLDGGATWSAEVEVSVFYDTALAARQPAGLYCSPKTPGLAYTAAYTANGAPAEALGFASVDWGETWTEMVEEEDPDEPLPFFGLFQQHQGASDEDEVYTALGVGTSASITTLATEVGSVAGIEEDAAAIIVAPPADTKRMVVLVTWESTRSLGGGCSGAMSLTDDKPTTVDQTGTISFTTPPNNTTLTGSQEIEWNFPNFATDDWPINRDTIQSSPPTSLVGCRVRAYCNANGAFDNTALTTTTFTVRVIEIELDDGTIYTPVKPGIIAPINSQAGAIHLPWPDNDLEDIFYYGSLTRAATREFNLRRAVAGTVIEIGPVDSGIDYGIHHGHFSVRSFDSDRQLMALGGIGNSTSSSAANDKVGLWVSSNAGTAWTNILAPVAASNAQYGLFIAFSGEDAGILFSWGGLTGGSLGSIYYSEDFGDTLDDRTGNLDSLVDGTYGEIAFLGIAGGPT